MKTSTLTHDAELKQKEQERGTKIFCIILTILSGAGAIGSALLIERAEIYYSKIVPPDFRLPLLTQAIIYGKLGLLILAILLTLAGLMGSFMPKRPHSTFWVLGCVTALILLSIIITIVLFLPLGRSSVPISGGGL